jgi:hypothetical protein
MTAALTTMFVLAGLAALAVPLARAAVHTPEAAASPTAPPAAAVACARASHDDYCGRYAADLRRRLPLTDVERTTAEVIRDRVIAVLPRGEPSQHSCSRSAEPCSSTYSPPTVDHVRQALVQAGYRDPVVRRARADDPAPVGSVLIAIPVGFACVLVHIDGNSAPATVRGQLANGRCVEG